MTVLARKKTTRKPVRRRPAAKAGSSFGKMGWMAAAVLATGWVASDGRALTYVGRLMHGAETQLTALKRPAPIREASFRTAPDIEAAPRPAVAERTRVPASVRTPRPAEIVPTHVAAIAPSPAPRLQPMRMPRPTQADEMPRQPPQALPPMRPDLRPPMAARPQPIAPQTVNAAPAGGLRHATRLLVMRDRPDDAGKHVGSVVGGMQVEVLKAEGHWRYVRADAGEGWVDGSFLAGESAALARPLPQTVLAAMPAAPASRLAVSAPLPPMAISSR